MYNAFPEGRAYYTMNVKDYSPYNINCVGNDDLFRAVSALREDSNMYQIFISKSGWFLCLQEKFEAFLNPDTGEYEDAHKASLAELQSHFKK